MEIVTCGPQVSIGSVALCGSCLGTPTPLGSFVSPSSLRRKKLFSPFSWWGN